MCSSEKFESSQVLAMNCWAKAYRFANFSVGGPHSGRADSALLEQAILTISVSVHGRLYCVYREDFRCAQAPFWRDYVRSGDAYDTGPANPESTPSSSPVRAA